MKAQELSRLALGVGVIGIIFGLIDVRTGLATAGAILVAGSVVAVAIIEGRT